ncbi:MAG: phosphate acyltransferase [Gemmatimonadota bacterium]
MKKGPPEFIRELRARARSRKRTLVFPEGLEPRIHGAVAELLDCETLHPVLLGEPEAVAAGLTEAGVDPSRVTLVDPGTPERVDRFGPLLYELRRAKGLPLEEARTLVTDPLIHGALMVRAGEAHGSLAGAVRTTGDVVLAALWGVGTAAGVSTVSSSFYMVFPADHPRGPAVVTFADAGVVPDPTPAQLAEIAAAAVYQRRVIVGDEPAVAFLSYSTHGSAEGPSVDRVREALALFREAMPGVAADGELQADAALMPEVALRKAPASTVGGRANILIFPDLDAANNAYKLVEFFGGALALGPVLQGLARPCNDLSRGSTVEDIVNTACITALMAQEPV